MSNNFASAYVEIINKELQDDGTMMVYGKATDDSLDVDQQICDAEWLDRAMPEWFKTGGNIREQHSSIAAGVAKEYERKSDGHYINTLIVDPLSVKKVETGVLKGFSIGIKSPRVVRDTKAVNGRIIDGQIVEVSLVDRPANPNAKLMLAKSVDGEASLVKVEEMHEYTAPLPSDVFKTAQKGSKMETIKQITDLAKSLTPDSVKFDQAKFDTALKAIADLIVVEASEISPDHSERESIEHLLDALKHLEKWYEGEVAEGEVPGVSPMPSLGDIIDEIVEGKSADTQDEEMKSEDCPDCTEDKMCDKCSEKEADADTEPLAPADKSATAKCLECGCDKPADAHGRADVSTATMVTPDETPKSADPTEEDKETSTEEPEVLAEEKTLVNDDVINTIIEKAVKSATDSVQAEIDLLKSAKEAALEKSVVLEQELAIAKSAAINGGPKRTAVSQGAESDNSEIKAAVYRAKAAAATDPVLAKGYREMAEEILGKSASSEQDNSDKE